MRQDDDQAANLADQIVQPAGAENRVVHAFVLDREVVDQNDAVQEHCRPDQPAFPGQSDQGGCTGQDQDPGHGQGHF